jgi:hypothetical protein
MVELEWRSDFSDGEKDFLKRWLTKATHTASQLAGTFPRQQSRLVIERADSNRRGSSRWPVPWGQTVRRGMDGVLFQVNLEKNLQEYIGDWTAPHEFSHLFIPYPGQRDIWLSEGFASYYQNILMAREGIYSEHTAWQKLYEGFMRAEQDRNVENTLVAVSEGRRRFRATMRVYWSGALFFLEADIELRKASNSQRSLDWVVDEYIRCCRDQRTRWDGEQMLASFDRILNKELADNTLDNSLIGENYFSRLYQRYSESLAIPDCRPLLAQVGINVIDNEIEFNDDANLQGFRRDFTRPRKPPLAVD